MATQLFYYYTYIIVCVYNYIIFSSACTYKGLHLQYHDQDQEEVLSFPSSSLYVVYPVNNSVISNRNKWVGCRLARRNAAASDEDLIKMPIFFTSSTRYDGICI